MAHVATLPAPDNNELDTAKKKQKNATKFSVRREFLEKGDNLLQRTPSLPEYQSITIEYRAADSHLSDDIPLTPRTVFDLI